MAEAHNCYHIQKALLLEPQRPINITELLFKRCSCTLAGVGCVLGVGDGYNDARGPVRWTLRPGPGCTTSRTDSSVS